MKMKRNNRGFTLVELMVTLAVFAIVSVAISSILVCAIRYSGISFREEANLREVMMVENVLDAALEDAVEIKALIPVEAEGTQKWQSVAAEDDSVEIEGDGMLLMQFEQQDNKFYEVLLIKTSGEPTKAWYHAGAELDWVPNNNEDSRLSQLGLLSEKISKVDIVYTDKTLDCQMTLKDGTASHSMHKYWNIGNEVEEK